MHLVIYKDISVLQQLLGATVSQLTELTDSWLGSCGKSNL